MTTTSHNMLREALDEMLVEVVLDRSIKKSSMDVDTPDLDQLGVKRRSSLRKRYNAINRLLSTDANIAPGYALVRPETSDTGMYYIIDVEVARSAMWKVYTTAVVDGDNDVDDLLYDARQRAVVGSIEMYPENIRVGGRPTRVSVVTAAALTPKVQGKGLMLAAYVHLITERGITLMSDSIQSTGGMKLWQQLAVQPGVKVRAWDRGGWATGTPQRTVDATVAKTGGFSTSLGPTHTPNQRRGTAPFLRLIATKG